MKVVATNAYRVEGEIGRFQFALYTLSSASGECIERSEEWFARCRAREWYKTTGFREEAIFLEASQRSYRTNVAHLNRSRRQERGGTPLTTLQHNAEREGAEVLSFLDKKSASVLCSHGFTETGEPANEAARSKVIGAGEYSCLPEHEVASAKHQLREAMQARDFSLEQIEQALERAAGQVYEQPESCTLVSIDDVGVKEQSAHRCRKQEPSTATPPNGEAKSGSGSRPTVQNTVAHIEKQGRCFFT